MADSKITALTSIGTSTDPVLDQMVIVDVSDGSMAATGTTKKVSLNQLLSSNPSATGGLTLSGALAAGSATITGDLTVDTSTLKVDSANNRVGIGTASPASLFTVYRNTSGEVARFLASTDSLGELTLTSSDNAGSGRVWTWNGVSAFANHVWQINSSTAMTLNSTGLGIGTASVTSGFKLDVVNGDFRVSDAAGADGVEIGWSAGSSVGFVQAYNRNTSAFKNLKLNDSVTIDTSGNVGVGVTPTNIAGVTRFEIKGSVSSQVVIRSGSANASARDWMISANFNAFGDFVIRQGNSQGADPNSGTDRLVIDASGRPIFYSGVTTPATLSTNGQLTMTATSDTNLRFSYRGSDGVTRVANLTLA